MTSRRAAIVLGLGLLLASAAGAAPPARASGETRRVAADPRGAELSALPTLLAGGDVEDGVATLLEQAAAQPRRASEIAAMLLLLDRNDAALDVLLDAGRDAEAFELLAGGLRLKEALALPSDSADVDRQLVRARALVLAGQPRDAARMLSELASGDERTALRAVREASSLGLRDDVLPSALDRAHAAGPAIQRDLAGALWPARRLQAEAAWRWLRRADASLPADDSLLRLREILDPSRPSRDADALLAGGRAGMGPVTPCEEPRIFAGMIMLAEERNRPDAALQLGREWTRTGGAPAWMALGDMLRDRQDWSGAAEAYAEAAQAAPGEGAALWLASTMTSKLGDDAGARALAGEAREQAATSCARMRLAAAMEDGGATGEAARLREEMLAEADSPALAANASVVARRSADSAGLQAARAAFRTAKLRALGKPLSVSGVLPLVRAAQAADLRAFVRLSELDEALAYSEHALDAFVLDADVTADLASALRAAGRGSDADALLARVGERVVAAASDFPESPRLLNARAWFGARTRLDLDAARAAAEHAAELAPSDAGILDTLAEVRFQQGDRAGALEAGRRAAALQPDRAYFRLQLDRFASGDPSSAPPVAAD